MFSKTLAAAVFAVVLCSGATVAFGEDLTPDQGEQAISPGAAAKIAPILAEEAKSAADREAAAEKEVASARRAGCANQVMIDLVAALKVRVQRLEDLVAASNRAANSGESISGNKLLQAAADPALTERIERLEGQVAADHQGLLKATFVSSKALERTRLLHQDLMQLRADFDEYKETHEPLSVGNDMLIIPSAFGGWEGTGIVGAGIGFASRNHEVNFKFDARFATAVTNSHREVDAMAAALKCFSGNGFCPYAGLHVTGVFGDGLNGGVTDTRLGLNAGAMIGIANGWQLDVRSNADAGYNSNILGLTAGVVHNF